MPIELLNPDGLPKPEPYRQVAVALGSRIVFLAGQVARTATGEPVGAGDLAAQVEQAYLNVATALAAVGGSFDDVAKLTLCVVDWTEDKLAAPASGGQQRASASTRSSRSPSSRSRPWPSPTCWSRWTPPPCSSERPFPCTCICICICICTTLRGCRAGCLRGAVPARVVWVRNRRGRAG